MRSVNAQVSPETRARAVAMGQAGVEATEIAAALDVSASAVYAWLRRHRAGEPLVKQRPGAGPLPARFVALQDAGLSLRQIAAEMGVGYSSARRWSVRRGARQGVAAGATPPGWWTPARTIALVEAKKAGRTVSEIAAEFGIACAAVKRKWTRVRRAFAARGIHLEPGKSGRPARDPGATAGDPSRTFPPSTGPRRGDVPRADLSGG